MRQVALIGALLGLGGISQPALADVDLHQFDSRYAAGVAAVRPKRQFPDSVVHQACRRVLTSPLRAEVRARLAERLALALPEEVSFVDAGIEGYRAWQSGDWLHCKGTVTVTDWPRNLAGLAIRVAWHHAGQKQPEPLRPLLKVALEHPSTTSDAVALIAYLAPKKQQQAYLDGNLASDHLTMPAAMQAVSEIWFEQGRWAEVIRLTERCDTLACRRLRLDAEEQKEMEDAEKVDDLSSYF